MRLHFSCTPKPNLQIMNWYNIILNYRRNRCIRIYTRYIPHCGGIGIETSKYHCDYDFRFYIQVRGDIHGWLLSQLLPLSRVFRSVKCDSHYATCIGMCLGMCLYILSCSSEIDRTRLDIIQGPPVLSEGFIFFVLFARMLD